MVKTPTTYKETKLGILEMREIEKIIAENLALTQKYVIRNCDTLSINRDLAKQLHAQLAGNLYQEAGVYRKHNVRLANFEPPDYFQMPTLMKDWEEDLQKRTK